jgi:hypothetical protein
MKHESMSTSVHESGSMPSVLPTARGASTVTPRKLTRVQ